MLTMIKNILFIALMCIGCVSYAQDEMSVSNPRNVQDAKANNKYLMPIATMAIKGSHPIGINSTKTVHIVFPSEIKEVDAGIPEILTQITPSFTNVLKVKAVMNEAFLESNLTVLTANGDLYSFIVNYQEEPEILNINVQNNYSFDKINAHNFNTSTFSKSDFYLPTVGLSENQIRANFMYVLSKNPRIKNVGMKELDVASYLVGLYMDNSLMYLRIKIKNSSGVNYPIDFVKVYVRDVETAKRQTIQEEELRIIKLDNIEVIEAGEEKDFVVAIPRITVSSDKQLEFETYEKKGGRHLRFPINSQIISNAKEIKR